MMRSLLFVPADSERKLDKSFGADADALIFDLEDAVAPERKPEARRLALRALGRERGGKQVYVRINAFDTGMALEDLAAVMKGRPDGVVLPKCGGGADVRQLHHWLDGLEAALGLTVGATRIIPVATETPAAVLNLASYAGSSTRLSGLMWGGEDLAGAIGASANRDGAHYGSHYRAPFALARNLCLLGAAAAGVLAIDAVYTDTRDMDGLLAEAQTARIEGFGAKALIHPAQGAVVNAAFSPSAQEVAWAKAVMRVIAESAGAGVATLDGKMIDRPHVVQAQRILGASSFNAG